jgi:hypothetical protein
MPRARVRGVVQPLVCCLPQLQMQWLGHRCTAIVAEPTAPQARQCAQPASYGSSAPNRRLAPVWSSAHCCAHLIARCSMLSAFCVGGQIRGKCCSEPCLVLLVGLSTEPCRVVPSTSCLVPSGNGPSGTPLPCRECRSGRPATPADRSDGRCVVCIHRPLRLHLYCAVPAAARVPLRS